MKVEENGLPDSREISASSIPSGQVFSGRIGAYRDKWFLRTYDRVVSLANPTSTWGPDLSFSVEDYRPVQAKLVIEKYL